MSTLPATRPVVEVQHYVETHAQREGILGLVSHMQALALRLFPNMRLLRVYLETETEPVTAFYTELPDWYIVFEVHLPATDFDTAREAARAWGAEWAAAYPQPRRIHFPLRLEVAE